MRNRGEYGYDATSTAVGTFALDRCALACWLWCRKGGTPMAMAPPPDAGRAMAPLSSNGQKATPPNGTGTGGGNLEPMDQLRDVGVRIRVLQELLGYLAAGSYSYPDFAAAAAREVSRIDT